MTSHNSHDQATIEWKRMLTFLWRSTYSILDSLPPYVTCFSSLKFTRRGSQTQNRTHYVYLITFNSQEHWPSLLPIHPNLISTRPSASGKIHPMQVRNRSQIPVACFLHHDGSNWTVLDQLLLKFRFVRSVVWSPFSVGSLGRTLRSRGCTRDNWLTVIDEWRRLLSTQSSRRRFDRADDSHKRWRHWESNASFVRSVWMYQRLELFSEIKARPIFAKGRWLTRYGQMMTSDSQQDTRDKKWINNQTTNEIQESSTIWRTCYSGIDQIDTFLWKSWSMCCPTQLLQVNSTEHTLSKRPS